MEANKIMEEITRQLCDIYGAVAALITVSFPVGERRTVLFRNRYKSTGENSNEAFVDQRLKPAVEQRLLFLTTPIRRDVKGGVSSVQEVSPPFSYSSSQFTAVPGLPPRWGVSTGGSGPLVFKGTFDGFDIEISLDSDRALTATVPGRKVPDTAFCFRLLEKALPLFYVQDYREDIPSRGKGEEIGLFDPRIIGNSEIIRSLKRQIQKVAYSELSVLIEGESGTGKEIIAKNIHGLSRRASAPLVTVNCMEVQPSLLRAELFGHAKGAFTGAVGERAGLIESARGGTFFLDEIGEMPANLQAALLRVIQEREIRRVGESCQRSIDVRFIFATNKNLSKLVEEGSFREDLFYRVCGTRMHVSPLRERKEDILLLASYFLHIQARRENVRVPRLDASAAKRMLYYNWPGNVRELANEMERVVAFNEGKRLIREEILSEKLTHNTGKRVSTVCKYSATLPAAMMKLEAGMISDMLNRFDGNRTKSAEVLGISRQGLLNKMKKYSLR